MATTASSADAAAKPSSAQSFGVQATYPFLRTPRRMRWIRWAVLWLLFAVVTGVLCYVMAHYYKQGLKRQHQKTSVFGDGTADFLVVFQPLKFDVTSSTLTALYTVTNQSASADPLGRISKTTVFQTGGTTASKTFTTGQQLAPFQVAYPIAADTSIYPFDGYSINITLFATYSGTGDLASIDLLAYLDEPLQSFRFEDVQYYNFTDADGNALNVVGFNFAFYRAFLTMALTIFSWVLMHMWTLMIVFLAVQCVFRDRTAHPFMVWAAASIFSMSTIRGIQPSAPVVGTYYDMGTYVWAVVISCAAAFVLFVVSFHKHKPTPEKDKLLAKMEKEVKLQKILREEKALNA
ncbi:hypothetical protein HK405_003854 [Cladochytrium tenue]|nr:hypothetical protein HK405_003854 [Cladochytrium tenue]